MGGNHSKAWSREETILALDLYYRLPIKDIRDYNPEVIRLSEIIGRTPGSVKAKLGNLAGCDPKRLGKSLVHGSATDHLVFEEFFNREGDLACEAVRIKTDLYKALPIILENTPSLPLGETRSQTVQVRIRQDFFRQAVLAAYENRCCITGLSIRELLIASHIKPWAQSDCQEKTNPCNGLALNPLHDMAFDRGLITVHGPEYKIRVSKKLSKANMDDATRDWMLSCHGHPISMPIRFAPCLEFLEYHNDVIFQG